jgi:hypothetical protein
MNWGNMIDMFPIRRGQKSPPDIKVINSSPRKGKHIHKVTKFHTAKA